MGKIQRSSNGKIEDQVNFKKNCGSFAVRRRRRVSPILLVTLGWTRKRRRSVNKGGFANMATPCLRAACWCQPRWHQCARRPTQPQKDFSMLSPKRMRTQDGKTATGSTGDSVIGNTYIIFLNLRAFWYSGASVCVDMHEFFYLAAAEATVTQQGSCHPLYEVAEPLILRQTAHTSTSGHVPETVAPNKKAQTGNQQQDKENDKQGTDLESRIATCNVSRICRLRQ